MVASEDMNPPAVMGSGQHYFAFILLDGLTCCRRRHRWYADKRPTMTPRAPKRETWKRTARPQPVNAIQQMQS